MRTSGPLPSEGRTRPRILLYALLALLGIRLIQPCVLRRVLNDRLARVPGYDGRADDLDLSLEGMRLTEFNEFFQAYDPSSPPSTRRSAS